MPPGIQIRPITLRDIDGVMALAARLEHAPQWPRSGYEAALSPGVWPERIALLAETGEGGVAGFLIAVIVPPQAELESIAVAPELQRRGLARSLFERLTGELRSREHSEILLEVRPSNHSGRAFYQALGFSQCGRRPAYYADPVEDAILMCLTL